MLHTSDTNGLLAITVNEWPPLSETFIVNEIRGMKKNGANIVIFALRKGSGRKGAKCPVYYRDDLSKNDILQGWKRLGKAICRAAALTWSSAPQLAYALRNVPTALGFSHIARSLNVAHVHGHFAHTPTDIAVMIARDLGIPVTFSAHAWDVYCTGGALHRRLDAADHCITCTESARSFMISHARRNVANKITAIHHGIDLAQFEFKPAYAPSFPPVFLAVGRLVPKKGFDHLLYACQRLKHHLDFHCTIVGEGPLKSRLHSMVSDMRLGNYVSMPGRIPHTRINESYEQSDLLIVPSVITPGGDRDGLPNVILEAMASGVPVLGSELSGIPEAIQHEETGLLVPPGNDARLADNILRMINNTDLRRRCIDNARQRVESEFNHLETSRKVFETLHIP